MEGVDKLILYDTHEVHEATGAGEKVVSIPFGQPLCLMASFIFSGLS